LLESHRDTLNNKEVLSRRSAGKSIVGCFEGRVLPTHSL